MPARRPAQSAKPKGLLSGGRLILLPSNWMRSRRQLAGRSGESVICETTGARSMTKSAAVYARFSSDHQNDRSITDQFSLCKTYAKREGFTIAHEFSDSAKTGYAIRPRRPDRTDGGGEGQEVRRGHNRKP